MQRILFVLIIANILFSVYNHVIPKTENTEHPTKMEDEPDKVDNPSINFKEFVVNNNTEFTKTFTADERESYIDSILYALKTENWSTVEEPCLNQTISLIHSLKISTLWAVWQWDSMLFKPQGLFYGNTYNLGSYDECINTPWHNTHTNLTTQYCLADIVLKRSDKTAIKQNNNLPTPYQSLFDAIEYQSYFKRPKNHLIWGLCMPGLCQPHSVQRLFGIFLARTHLGAAGLHARITINAPCQTLQKPREYDILFISFFVVMGSLTLFVLLCTYIRHNRIHLIKSTIGSEILKAFCVKNNSMRLLNVKKEGVDVFYGIRFFTICLIVAMHHNIISSAGPIDNGFALDEAMLYIRGLFMLHTDLLVDTFFLLSGFLLASGLTKFKKIPNPFLIILIRYVRLAVGLAVIIFFISAVFPYIGTGPLWDSNVVFNTKPCRENWWLNLLMINNYIDTENMCMITTWYVACDFHFFIVTVLLYWLYQRYPKVGVFCALLVSIFALITPGIVNYIYKLSPILFFKYNSVTNPLHQHFDSYIKSHNRYACFLIGFITRLIINHYKATGINKIPKIYSTLVACGSLAIMFLVMIYGSILGRGNYGRLESAFYVSLDRPIWACSLAFFVFCCSFGEVPIIKGFLCWYPWIPLSKLAYGLYLIHAMLSSRYVFVTRSTLHTDLYNFSIEAVGIMAWGCLAAYVLLVVVEMPVNNLLILYLRAVNSRKAVESCIPPQANGEENMGHQEDNLPSSVNITTKI